MIVIKSGRLRKSLKIIIPYIIAPLIVILGATVFEDKQYAFITVAMVLFAVVLFLCGFEKKSIGTRRLVIVSVITALSVVGRFIPLFKPITALTIITAMYLGGESGFLVGAMSAVISNFYFGQGPWTPFQMLAWGFIGLISGLISEPLKKSRALLLILGVATGILYSFIMDVWTVLWYNNSFDWGLYSAALLSAVPYTIMYSVSNVIFLFVFAKPIGEKLERVKIKYGV